MSTFEHQTHHINYHTSIQRTDMEIFLGDTSRSGQHPPNALCLSLLHHTTMGTVQKVDFLYSAFKMATFLPHMLKII